MLSVLSFLKLINYKLLIINIILNHLVTYLPDINDVANLIFSRLLNA